MRGEVMPVLQDPQCDATVLRGVVWRAVDAPANSSAASFTGTAQWNLIVAPPLCQGLAS